MSGPGKCELGTGLATCRPRIGNFASLHGITVREHARLTTESIPEPSLDRAQVSGIAFDWLCDLNGRLGRGGASLVEVEGRRWLRLDNYVGVLETPCGTSLEILPKHADLETASSARRLLTRLVSTAFDLPSRETTEASVELFKAPINEWVMGRFVSALDRVIQRGIRSDYTRVEASERFLRGQLDIVRQMGQPPGRQHIFQLRHDVFSPDRPENRLARSALERVCRATAQPDTWRLAQELRGLMQCVPVSVDVSLDFTRWSSDRLMAHYKPLRPWCELVLGERMPRALAGNWRGISLLFPMEKLFERTVVAGLRRALHPQALLTPQAASKWLCSHSSTSIFRLEPDLLVNYQRQAWLIDAKWKMLDARTRQGNYGIAQGDFYQLFACAHRYLEGSGEVVLVYPRHPQFTQPLASFNFSETLRLWVMPFDLETEELIGKELSTIPLKAASQ